METELGWVLSGPMKCKSNDDVVSTQVNLITSVCDQTFEGEVQGGPGGPPFRGGDYVYKMRICPH